jgi:hypothetical protein
MRMSQALYSSRRRQLLEFAKRIRKRINLNPKENERNLINSRNLSAMRYELFLLRTEFYGGEIFAWAPPLYETGGFFVPRTNYGVT